MADAIINGKEVVIDLSKITMRQWRDMHNPTFSDGEDDKVMAAVSGLTVEELDALPMQEYKRLFDALVKKMRAPLNDPN
jgi:hypothetical protein